MKKTSLTAINLSITFCLSFLLFGSSLFSTLQAQVTVTTPYTNSGTWTVPSKVSSVKVEAWGAGGAGGRTGSGDPYRHCGGGGGGAYTYHILSVNRVRLRIAEVIPVLNVKTDCPVSE